MIFAGIKRQLRSVVEWRHPAPDVLFEQWTDNGDEIKNASKLIVGPGQGCIFIYEGVVKAVIQSPCMIELQTANIPFWTTIKKVMQFFVSEHKVGLYFYRTARVVDQKWGTTSMIKYADPHYQFPVGLQAYGNFSYQMADAERFFTTLVGGQAQYGIDEFRQVMMARIVHPLTDYLAESRFSYVEIDANREEIAANMLSRLAQTFSKLGVVMTDFRIEGTHFDPETQQRIQRIANVMADAQAAQQAGLDFAQLQQLEAMRDAARNESGAAGAGMGIGAGIGFGQVMSQTMTAPKVSTEDIAAKLAQLKQLHEAGLMTAQEYADKRKAMIDAL
ncbi:MAG: SPFH domain-containing protein [Methylococcales bacterium]|nr:SPFH domain-containing protein [Methylococcales bacterium]